MQPPRAHNSKARTTMAFLNEHKQQIAALCCLVLLFIVLGIASPNILQTNNILNIGKQASINLIIALGMTVVVLSGGIDLSVGSLLALLVVVAARLNNVSGVDIWIATFVGFLCAVAGGLANGLLVQWGNVPPFVATLGTMGIIRGIVLNLAQGHPGMSFPRGFLYIADGSIGLPLPILIAVAMTIGVWLMLRFTVSGRCFYVLGGNEEAARLSGINVFRARVLPYVVSGVCCAVAGIVFAARVGAAPPGAGQGYELNSIAAVVIGGNPLSGGHGKIIGTAIGALLIAVIQNGLTILNVDPYWQGIIVGAIILVAVITSNFRRRQV
jgi:ribose/xylose/arabinose/galactoside ABC-type transport system permease subunit